MFQDKHVYERLKNRGPDSVNSVKVVSNEKSLYFYGSVLWMQGIEKISQPVENKKGILLFNGDIFEDSWNKTMSDTYIIMEKLTNVRRISTPIKN